MNRSSRLPLTLDRFVVAITLVTFLRPIFKLLVSPTTPAWHLVLLLGSEKPMIPPILVNAPLHLIVCPFVTTNGVVRVVILIVRLISLFPRVPSVLTWFRTSRIPPSPVVRRLNVPPVRLAPPVRCNLLVFKVPSPKLVVFTLWCKLFSLRDRPSHAEANSVVDRLVAPTVVCLPPRVALDVPPVSAKWAILPWVVIIRLDLVLQVRVVLSIARLVIPNVVARRPIIRIVSALVRRRCPALVPVLVNPRSAVLSRLDNFPKWAITCRPPLNLRKLSSALVIVSPSRFISPVVPLMGWSNPLIVVKVTETPALVMPHSPPTFSPVVVRRQWCTVLLTC